LVTTTRSISSSINWRLCSKLACSSPEFTRWQNSSMDWAIPALARLKAGQFTHAEQVLSDGSYLLTLHPLGLPAVQVRVIEYRIEPHTAERLAQFPSSHTTNHADPLQLHRLVTTLLDPQQAPAADLILYYHERS